MSEKKQIDVVVVGLGLAGVAVCETFLQRGKSVLVYDVKRPSSSSRVAAGLWNPIAFRKMKTAWRATEFFPLAERFYKDLEQKLGTAFWHETGIARLFDSEEESERWQERKAETPFSGWIKGDSPDLEGVPLQEAQGFGYLNYAGYLDTNTFLDAYRNHLKEKGSLIQQSFDYAAVQLHNNRVATADFIADFLVCCEGPKIVNNPWFKTLEHYQKKGEILTIKDEQLELPCILNKSLFLMPLGNQLFRLGSSYDWDKQDEVPTEKGKRQLLEKAGQFITLNAEVTEHKAGLRPSSKDRHPLVGQHNQHPQLVVFNGLASRGVTQAPALADYLYGLLFENAPVDESLMPYRKMMPGGSGGGNGRGNKSGKNKGRNHQKS